MTQNHQSHLLVFLVFCVTQIVGFCVCLGAWGNYLDNSSFETKKIEWQAMGKNAVGKFDSQERHSGKRSYKIRDTGPTMVQMNTSWIPIQPRKQYFIEAWIKTDIKAKNTARLDVQYLTSTGKYRRAVVGNVQSGKWSKISKLLIPPEGTVSMRLRLMPAFSSTPAAGSAWIDDVRICAAEDLPEWSAPAQVKSVMEDFSDTIIRRPPQFQESWFPHVPQVDFESLEGWTVTGRRGIKAEFYRSKRAVLAGDFVGRLVYSSRSLPGIAELRPPEPIALEGCDRVQLWVLGNSGWANPQTLSILIEDGEGNIHNVKFPDLTFKSWAPVDIKLGKKLSKPLKFAGIVIGNLVTDSGETNELYFDNLSFYKEDQSPIPLAIPTNLPFPTRPETILPTVKGKIENLLQQKGRNWIFLAKSDKGTSRFVYKPLLGTLDDIWFGNAKGKLFRVAKGGGPVIDVSDKDINVNSPKIKRRFLGASRDGNTVVAKWQFRKSGDAPVTIVYRLEMKGHSLIISAKSEEPRVTAFLSGDPEYPGIKRLMVPYLLYNYSPRADETSIYYTGDGLFISHLWDYYNSDGSSLSEPKAEYHKDTRGRRHPLSERLFITCSTDFQEVLPNIPNPPSPYRDVAGKYVFVCVNGYDGAAYKKYKMMWRRMKRYGMDYIIAKHHSDTWNPGGGGDQPWSQTVTISPTIPGGEKAVTEYLCSIRKLGFIPVLFSDYVVFSPMHAEWDDRWACQDQDGTMRRAWLQAYTLTPLKTWDFAAEWEPKLKKKFKLRASYCDQHTAAVPWRRALGRLDYDARKPYAAQHKAVFYGYGKTFLVSKKVYDGPVYSEGGSHWFYSGLVDGSYAQLRWTGRFNQRYLAPFLVDFDLLKIHPLSFNLGMGWRQVYGPDTEYDIDGSKSDRLLCATIAFAHYGLLSWPDFTLMSSITQAYPLGKEYTGLVLKQYFMIQQLQTFYAQVPVKSIRYFDGQRLIDTSQAILNEAYRRNQVRVEYDNGLVVCANGNFQKSWKVKVAGHNYLLPPGGYVACLPGKIVEYSALSRGHRVDFVDAPEYLYADGRGHKVDFGAVKTKDILIVKKKTGELEVIPVSPNSSVTLRLKKFGFVANRDVRVAALDKDRKLLWEKHIVTDDGTLVLKRENEIFSFKVTSD